MDNNKTRILDALVIPLLQWYEENARVLPWRSQPTVYRVWVSEIMLQQTRVTAVLEYFDRFMRELPTVFDLAKADEEKLMKLWQGLGYYSRARNLQKAALLVVDLYGGTFPAQYDQILSLPGIGEYTAGAIASIAFGNPVPAVDGNVLRVVLRILASYEDVSRGAVKNSIRQQLQKIMPQNRAGDFNQALMELGAMICLPNGALLCTKCPAREICLGYKRGCSAQLPVKPPKGERRKEEKTVFLIFSEAGVAVRRRPKKGLLAGLWEFPNEAGRISTAESAEVFDKWGVRASGVTPTVTGKHIFTHIRWDMTGLAAVSDNPWLPDGWRWADEQVLRNEIAVPSAFQIYLREALKRIK